MTAQLLSSELSAIFQDSKRKNQELRNVSDQDEHLSIALLTCPRLLKNRSESSKLYRKPLRPKFQQVS